MSSSAFLDKLEAIIANRLANPPTGSYTAELASAGTRRIAQKVGEEAVELALASVDGERDDIVSEAADLVYHLLVLLNDRDISIADVTAALEARHR